MMKTFKFAIFMAALFTAGVISSCGNKSHSHDHQESTSEMTGNEYTSEYVCPMHCEGSGSEHAGECPVCGMDYVLRTDHESDGHTHEQEDHDGHEGHNH